MKRAVRRGAAGAVLGLALSGCVSDNFPARPTVTTAADAGAGPTLLVSAPGCVTDSNVNYVVFDDKLFWTETMAGTVNSISTSGGSKTVIAAGQMAPGPLAVDGTSLYWVGAGKKRIMKKTRGDDTAPTVLVEPGTATEVVGDENEINAVLVSSGTLYFGRYTSALKVPTAGGTPIPIGQSPDLGQPAAFALDPDHLYQTELGHEAISRETIDGLQDGLIGDGNMTRERLAPDRIAVSQGGLLADAIAVVNGNVIWVDSAVIGFKPVGARENDPSFQIVSAPNSIKGFVVSDDTVFFGESDYNKVNIVAKVPLSAPLLPAIDAGAVDARDAAPTDAASANADAADAGGSATPVIIATDQKSPSQFAADATNIYWRTADCKIMKLAK